MMGSRRPNHHLTQCPNGAEIAHDSRRWLQDSHKMARDPLKIVPRWLQDGPGSPRWPEDGSRWAQNGPKINQNAPKMTQDDPTRVQETSRWPHDSSEAGEDGYKKSLMMQDDVSKAKITKNHRIKEVSNKQSV